MTNSSDEELSLFTKETYDGSFNAALLEQYKLYAQPAENVSARRVPSSRYLLTVNAALVALYGLHAQIPAPLGLLSWYRSWEYWSPCCGIGSSRHTEISTPSSSRSSTNWDRNCPRRSMPTNGGWRTKANANDTVRSPISSDGHP